MVILLWRPGQVEMRLSRPGAKAKVLDLAPAQGLGETVKWPCGLL